VEALLRGHTDIVNVIKFFPTTIDQPRIILSGSVDKTIRVWREQSSTAFELAATWEGHSSSINCLASSEGVNFVASGSADATLKIWRVNIPGGKTNFESVQTIQTNPRLFPLALTLHSLDVADGLVLAVAGTKSIVQVYGTSEDGVFTLQATLTGHESWVRSIAITPEKHSKGSDLILASAGQDKYIRLWRITKGNGMTTEKSKGPIRSLEQSLSNKAHTLELAQSVYRITFEALLLGHEDWVYNIAWRLGTDSLQLLSASADSSLAIWQQDESSGVWVCTTRLGEISAQKGSTTATGSTGGFWIGLWSSDGDTLVSLGRTGSWRLWNYHRDQTRWTQGTGISGHTKPIADIAWSKTGSYLLSTGSDQTTRIHAARTDGTKRSWHEMGRPQIHGYDLNCIDTIGQTRFITGADEKLLRVFDEPRATANLLDRLCGVKISVEAELPGAADIPALGLSNKTIDDSKIEEYPVELGEARGTASATTSAIQESIFDSEHPPVEDELARHTLWPETEKLYGHGYEISAVAASHDGTLVATSCKASSLNHAVIRLYFTRAWREVKPSLTAHSLTVTALRFSGDDRYLLSVGRDRQWAVFERDEHNHESYLLKYSDPKGHSRMILSCCWAPVDIGRIFATASRDKTAKVWTLNDGTCKCTTTINLASPTTAIDISPRGSQHAIIIASGTETGEVWLHVLRISDWTIEQTSKLDDS
jgi:elongator complex protein 2